MLSIGNQSDAVRYAASQYREGMQYIYIYVYISSVIQIESSCFGVKLIGWMDEQTPAFVGQTYIHYPLSWKRRECNIWIWQSRIVSNTPMMFTRNDNQINSHDAFSHYTKAAKPHDWKSSLPSNQIQIYTYKYNISLNMCITFPFHINICCRFSGKCVHNIQPQKHLHLYIYTYTYIILIYKMISLCQNIPQTDDD